MSGKCRRQSSHDTGAALTERSGIAPKMNSRRDDEELVDKGGAPVMLDSSRTPVQRLHLDSIEPIEYSVGGDPREGRVSFSPPLSSIGRVGAGDVVTDLELPKATEKIFQNSFQSLLVGTRLDAIDHKGQWYPGTLSSRLSLSLSLSSLTLPGQILAIQSPQADSVDKERKIRFSPTATPVSPASPVLSQGPF
jgi:hypothetical protein